MEYMHLTVSMSHVTSMGQLAIPWFNLIETLNKHGNYPHERPVETLGMCSMEERDVCLVGWRKHHANSVKTWVSCLSIQSKARQPREEEREKMNPLPHRH